MDDQQGRLTLSEDAVGGLIVGEGSFFITKVTRKNRNPDYRPAFVLAMCDRTTMEAVADTFREWGLPYYWYDYQWKGNRPVYRLQVTGVRRMDRVLTQLRPHLFGDKRLAADAMHRYIRSRLERSAETGNNKHTPFIETELALIAEVKAINKGQAPQRLHAAPSATV